MSVIRLLHLLWSLSSCKFAGFRYLFSPNNWKLGVWSDYYLHGPFKMGVTTNQRCGKNLKLCVNVTTYITPLPRLGIKTGTMGRLCKEMKCEVNVNKNCEFWIEKLVFVSWNSSLFKCFIVFLFVLLIKC